MTQKQRTRLLVVSITCALGLPLGAHAQSTTTREQQLENKVDQLEAELAELKAEIQQQKTATAQATQTAQNAQATANQAQVAATNVQAAPASALPGFTSAPGINVALHGFISASAFGQNRTFANYGNGQNAEIPAPPTPANLANGYGGSLSGVDVRNTRFWLDFSGAKFAGDWTGGGRIEMDFFGGDNGTGAYAGQQPIPRLRQAYFDLLNAETGTDIRIGQQWELMFPVDNTAQSLSHIAFPLGYGSGFIGWRYPGVVLMQDLNHGSDGPQWRMDVGAFSGNWNGPSNEAGTATTNYLTAGNAHFEPQLEARLRVADKDWLAYLAAHWSKIDLHGVGDIVADPKEDKITSVGYELGGQWTPGPWVMKLLAYDGKALGELFGAMSQFGDIKENGGYAQVGYKFTPNWSAYAYYSLGNPDKNDVIRWTTTGVAAGTSLLKDNESALSLQYSAGAYDLSVEWLYDKLRYQVGSLGDPATVRGNQVSLNGRYSF